jgi:hypothetical protein
MTAACGAAGPRERPAAGEPGLRGGDDRERERRSLLLQLRASGVANRIYLAKKLARDIYGVDIFLARYFVITIM